MPALELDCFVRETWRIPLLSAQPPSALLGHPLPRTKQSNKNSSLPTSYLNVDIVDRWPFILIPATTRQPGAFYQPPFEPYRNRNRKRTGRCRWSFEPGQPNPRQRSIRLEIRGGDKRRESAHEAAMCGVRRCWSSVGLLVFALLGVATASHAGRPKQHDSLHWVAKAQVTAHPFDLLKRDEGTCQTGSILCPASLSGGCCPSQYECHTDSCYATTAGPQTACGLEGFFQCAVEDSGAFPLTSNMEP